MKVTIMANIAWRWGQSPRGKYIAICDALAQTVQADTFEELTHCMHEAVENTFQELLETDDLDEFLKEHKWKATSSIPKQKKRVSFDVPFDLKRVKHSDLKATLCA